MITVKIKEDTNIEYFLMNMVDILNYSNSLLIDSYRMLLTKNNKEFIFINRNKFLRKTQIALFKLGIIELCKLFGRKQTNHFSLYNIETLAAKFDIKFNLSIEHLNNPDVMKKISLLHEMRNQHFAHTDLHFQFDKKNGKRNMNEIKFYFDDAFNLINIAELIIEELYDKLNLKRDSEILNNENDADLFLTKQKEQFDKVCKTTTTWVFQKNFL